ncbi:YdaS family helix-turn-helix protein [Acetobacter pasteurianus]
MFVWQTYDMEPRKLISRVGGPTVLARGLGLRHSTPLLWKRIPPHHCPTIERIFGIPREELRPDLFKRTPVRDAAQ